MDYIIEIAIGIFIVVFAYILRELSALKKSNSSLDSRLSIEESKGGSRDRVAEKTLALLDKIHDDISSIKEEQGYWRGRHDQESPS